MSEGDYVTIRPHKPVKNGPKDTDESTDTYDTIDWLVKNVPGNTGKVGMWGISQPGFYATAGMIDAHPALVAVAPQAPVTDYYMGDDSITTARSCWRTASVSTWASAAAKAIPNPRSPPCPFSSARRTATISFWTGLARQRRREILQAQAAALEPEHRAHHL